MNTVLDNWKDSFGDPSHSTSCLQIHRLYRFVVLLEKKLQIFIYVKFGNLLFLLQKYILIITLIKDKQMNILSLKCTIILDAKIKLKKHTRTNNLL